MGISRTNKRGSSKGKLEKCYAAVREIKYEILSLNIKFNEYDSTLIFQFSSN